MVKILSIIIITLTIFFSSFELTLFIFHSPFGIDIANPKAHNLTWIYLLKQKYITFIDLDIFNINEKRHLLDVKRLLNRIYTIWIYLLISSIFIIIYLKNNFITILKYITTVTIIVNSLLIIFSLNFIENFNFLHKLLFPSRSWVFEPNSILIEWFPISYFIEFFAIFIIIYFLIILFLERIIHD